MSAPRLHASDCAAYNGPAYTAGPCDCRGPAAHFRTLIRALHKFRRSCKITPLLRERSVKYALASGARGDWDVTRQADKIAAYIATGEA